MAAASVVGRLVAAVEGQRCRDLCLGALSLAVGDRLPDDPN
jgi:hypothetical protein